MALPDVSVKRCVQEMVKLDLQIKAIIQDIRECQGPIEVLNDFNTKVREKIYDLKDRLEELERLAREQDKESVKVALLKDVENHRKQLSSTQSSLRKANLSCQLGIEKREKDILLGDSTEVRKRKSTGKEGIAKTASNITENLMSISRMMAAQVQQSENTMTTLVTSSNQVTETHEEFKGMTGHIQTSRKLLTKYNRREFTDKLLIFLALVFFFATVLYITKKRLF